MRDIYATWLDWCLNHPKITLTVGVLIFAASLLLVPIIGGEFLPHLDEGALWVRATMPYTISFEDSSKFAPKVRDLLAQYPQVTVVGSELGRNDDGTDPTGFFNCEFYVGLKPYNDVAWKAGSIHSKQQLTEDIEKKLQAYPGVIFNYTQPAEDAVDEALTGLKSALAVKIFGPDLDVLEKKAVEIKNVLGKTPGFAELTVVRELGQPSLIIDADRQKIARYGINVADVEAVVQAAVGGQTATQVIQGEKLFDLVVRMEPQYRSNAHDIGALLVPAPGGQQIPLSELSTIKEGSGASFIYRENNSRYIGIQFSAEGRDLEGIVKAGQNAVRKQVTSTGELHAGLGRRIHFAAGSQSAAIHYRAAGDFADLSYTFRAVRKFQVSDHHRAGRGNHPACRRAGSPEINAHAFQRFQHSRAPRSAWRIRANRRHSGQLHQ